VSTAEWLTLDEAAAYLKVSKPTVYRLCASGALPFYQLGKGGPRRFRRADLDAQLVPGEPGEPVANPKSAA
jgi:excisionase family DNA binding protein